MSKGTPIRPVRIENDLIRAVIIAVARRNRWTLRAPWSVSDFIRVAIREKLSKMRRSREDRRR